MTTEPRELQADRAGEAAELVARLTSHREALSSRESEFLTSMEERCEKYGEKAFVSLKQIFWLRDLEQRVWK